MFHFLAHGPPMHIIVRLFVASLLLCPLVSRAEENWPQYRGPTGQGVSDSKGLPTAWSQTQNVKWKTPIHGKGWSSPVIWGNQVWLTTATEDGRELYVLCIDKETGKITQDIKLFEDPAPNPVFKNYNSYASPTPVIEKDRIYVTFGAAGTACLDTTSAVSEPIWQRRDLRINHFRGAGSSPLIYKDLLIQDYDGSDHQFVIALNKETGKTVWRTERSVDYNDLDANGKPKGEGDFRKGFSTCRIATVNGKPAVISVGSKATYAYEPETGKEIWRFEHPDWHSAGATPVIGDGLIYVCPGFSKGAVLAIRPDGQGVLGQDHLAFKIGKNAPDKQSPLLVDGLLYFIDSPGIASCVDAKTGTEVWRQRIAPNFSAAPLYGDGKVYFCSDGGVTTVIEAGRTFKKLAANKLDSAFKASPAVSGKALYLRTLTALYRIEE
jgi:outer membrane protein assembly factor BamB